MGKPIDPCFKIPTPYISYNVPTLTTPSPSPVDTDFFALSDEEYDCYDNISGKIRNFHERYDSLTPTSIKVSDIIINDFGCDDFYLYVSGVNNDFFKINNNELYFDYLYSTKNKYETYVNTININGELLNSTLFTLNVEPPCYYCVDLYDGYYCVDVDGYYCVEIDDGYYCVETPNPDPYYCVRVKDS
jgi:hypothetical protein